MDKLHTMPEHIHQTRRDRLNYLVGAIGIGAVYFGLLANVAVDNLLDRAMGGRQLESISPAAASDSRLAVPTQRPH